MWQSPAPAPAPRTSCICVSLLGMSVRPATHLRWDRSLLLCQQTYLTSGGLSACFQTPDPSESVTLGPATIGISWAARQAWCLPNSGNRSGAALLSRQFCSISGSLLFCLLGLAQDHRVLSISLQGAPQSQDLHKAAGSNSAILQMRNWSPPKKLMAVTVCGWRTKHTLPFFLPPSTASGWKTTYSPSPRWRKWGLGARPHLELQKDGGRLWIHTPTVFLF